jgi:hypothetical protein
MDYSPLDDQISGTGDQTSDAQPVASAPVTPSPLDAQVSDASASQAVPVIIGNPHTTALGPLATIGMKSVSNVVGIPRGIIEGTGMLANYIARKTGANVTPDQRDSLDDWAAQHLPSSDEAMQTFNHATGTTPYQFQTPVGRIAAAGASDVLPALLSPVGNPITNAITGMAGGSAGQTVNEVLPGHPGLAALASLAAGGGVQLGAGGVNKLNSALNVENSANRAAAATVVKASSQSPNELISSIQSTAPDDGIQLSLGAQTGNYGLQNAEYNLRATDGVANDTRVMNSGNNQIFDKKIDRIVADQSPAPTETMPQTVPATEVQGAVSNLGTGLPAEDAGQAIQNQLTANLNAAKTARQTAFQPYEDAVKNSSATVDLTPVVQRLDDQIAGSSGERLAALQKARAQFAPPQGAIPANPPAPTVATILGPDGQPIASNIETSLGPTNINHAQQVLENLGDAADSFPIGSKQQQAVIAVRKDLSQHLQDNAPLVMDRNNAYANLSQPLDIFTKPNEGSGVISSIVAKDKNGDFTGPVPSAIPDKIMTGQGVPEKMADYMQAHGNDPAAQIPLQQHITQQINDNAINDDGTLNQAAFNKITGKYGTALDQMPEYQAKLQAIQDAENSRQTLQAAENARAAAAQTKQDLLSDLDTKFRTHELDQSGNNIIGMKFTNFIRGNDDLIRGVLGDTHADVLNNIADTIEQQQQPNWAKASGTSGTAQTATNPNGSVLKSLSRLYITNALGAAGAFLTKNPLVQSAANVAGLAKNVIEQQRAEQTQKQVANLLLQRTNVVPFLKQYTQQPQTSGNLLQSALVPSIAPVVNQLTSQ